jgi:predicted cupin superfamily sugar epimerase
MVKASSWFGLLVKAGGKYLLVVCTVVSGFDFRDGKKEMVAPLICSA